VGTVSDDDWFERAIGEDAEDADGDDPDAETDRDEIEAPDGTGSGSADGNDSVDDADDADETAGDEHPFEEEFAAAFRNAPDPDVSGSGTISPGSDAESPVGSRDRTLTGRDSRSPVSPSGAGAEGAESGEFGFSDFESDAEGFDEEAFESDLERLDIGIEGLDEMILGGVPKRSLMVAIGSAGTGKTTFGLQFLHHGLERDEDAVYITLEEGYDRILATAEEKGWGFEEYVESERLAVVDMDPVEMANSLDSIQNDLPELIESFGADRLVLDSVSLLEMMYERTPERRSQIFEFTRALKSAGVTTLMTSEANESNPYVSRFGIVEYLADAVFVLQYVRPTDFRETRLAIEIQKIRDANHSRETKPYELTGSGISVYRQATIF
jgi:KaiC domain protein